MLCVVFSSPESFWEFCGNSFSSGFVTSLDWGWWFAPIKFAIKVITGKELATQLNTSFWKFHLMLLWCRFWHFVVVRFYSHLKLNWNRRVKRVDLIAETTHKEENGENIMVVVITMTGMEWFLPFRNLNEGETNCRLNDQHEMSLVTSF